jgi:hypothetical protein
MNTRVASCQPATPTTAMAASTIRRRLLVNDPL